MQVFIVNNFCILLMQTQICDAFASHIQPDNLYLNHIDVVIFRMKIVQMRLVIRDTLDAFALADA